MAYDNEKLARRRAITARWCDLFVYAAIACATLFLCGYWFADFTNKIIAMPNWAYGALAAIVVVLSRPWSRIRRSRWCDFKHFGTYPPLWFASLLGGSGAIWVGASFFHEAFLTAGIGGTERWVPECASAISGAVAVIGACTTWVAHWRSRSRPNERLLGLEQSDTVDRLRNYEGIVEWISGNDEAIESSHRFPFNEARATDLFRDPLVVLRLYKDRDPAQWTHEPMVQSLIAEAKARLAD